MGLQPKSQPASESFLERPLTVAALQLGGRQGKNMCPQHSSGMYYGLRVVSALESVVATGQHQMHSERSACFVLGTPRLPCGR